MTAKAQQKQLEFCGHTPAKKRIKRIMQTYKKEPAIIAGFYFMRKTMKTVLTNNTQSAIMRIEETTPHDNITQLHNAQGGVCND